MKKKIYLLIVFIIFIIISIILYNKYILNEITLLSAVLYLLIYDVLVTLSYWLNFRR
jgi:hypothetical protein